MKKLFCFILLGLLLTAHGCQAVINTNEASFEESKQGSAASAPDNAGSRDVSAASSTDAGLGETSRGTSDDTSVSGGSEEPPVSSAEQIVGSVSSAEQIINNEYAIDIAPYLESIYSENLLLVNKEKYIDASYVPANLVNVTYKRYDDVKMDAVAEKALCAFLKEAYYYGYKNVTVTSAYRSYSSQKWYFNYYIENEMKSGKTREQATASVLTYSARPGTSEHQTGLCADMHNLPSADQSFGNTAAGKWMAENAHRFGFIVRYPKGKEDITGYSYEPWHFRFVGIEHATVIYEEGLCLEEYLAKYYPDKVVG